MSVWNKPNGRKVVRVHGEVHNYARYKMMKLRPCEGMANMVVHHKDGNPLNDMIDNLVWLTHAEHAKMHGWA